MYHRSFFDNEGFYVSGFTHVDNHWEWRNGLEIHTGVNFIHEGVQTPFEINEGTFVLPGNYDRGISTGVYERSPKTTVFFSYVEDWRILWR